MIDWIITSSVIILVVAATRKILKGHISLRLQYAMWGLVMLRLMIPFSFGDSGMSVMNAARRIPVVEDAERVSGIEHLERD